jgi:molecular chaperone IbpA
MTLTAKQLFPRSAFVGFDTMIDELDRISRHSGDTFPPHNILKTGEDQYLIELATAGFSEAELEIEVKNRTLTIRGQHNDTGRDYIHKGISTKKFERQFRLSEYVEVMGADFRQGLLAIKLEVIIPENQRPRKVEINGSNTINDPQLLNEETINATDKTLHG